MLDNNNGARLDNPPLSMCCVLCLTKKKTTIYIINRSGLLYKGDISFEVERSFIFSVLKQLKTSLIKRQLYSTQYYKGTAARV